MQATHFNESSPFNQTALESSTSAATDALGGSRTQPEIASGGFFLLLIILMTFLGNGLVILAIVTYRQLKDQQSNLFILNLAMADLGVVITVMAWTFISLVTDTALDTMLGTVSMNSFETNYY